MSGTMYSDGARELLDLWERGVNAVPHTRPDVLLAAQVEPPPTSLGARNAALLSLRARLFGCVQQLRSTCAGCGCTVEFSVDCDVLARELLPAAGADREQTIEVDGYRIAVRAPDAIDLRAAAARSTDRGAFVRALLERCVTRCERSDGSACDPATLPALAAAALSRGLEALDPGATVRFDLACPECGRQWTARMDCADVLWSEVRSRAERVLLEIDALARAYGWTEGEVLALSATRRAAYLQLAGAA